MSATLALARVMSYSEELAEDVGKKKEVVDIFVDLVNKSNAYEKKIGAYALRSIAKHSMELAEVVLKAKGLEALKLCLDNDDTSVREIAASALSQLAKFNPDQAQMLQQQGVIDKLVECIKRDHEENLKREALGCLIEIAKHNEGLADGVLRFGTLMVLEKLMVSPNVYVRRQVFRDHVNSI